MHRREKVKFVLKEQKKTEHYLRVILQCSQIIKLPRKEKEFIQYFNLRGVAYARLNNYDKAISDFNAGIELFNKEDCFKKEDVALILFNRALTLLMKKDYENAIKDLSYISSEKNAYLHYFLGVIYFHQENKVKALRHFLFALTMDSGKVQQDDEKFENEENDREIEARNINFEKLKSYLCEYSGGMIYDGIVSFPYELSMSLLKQCVDPATFLGRICKKLNENEVEQIKFSINYLKLKKNGCASIFVNPAAVALDKLQDGKKLRISSELKSPRLLSRSQ